VPTHFPSCTIRDVRGAVPHTVDRWWVYVCIYTYTYILHIYVSVCEYMCRYIFVFVCECECVRDCMLYAYVYTHTHTHTHTHELWIEERTGIWAHMPLCAGEKLISFKGFYFVVLVSSFLSCVG